MCSLRIHHHTDPDRCTKGHRRAVRAWPEAGPCPGHQRLPGAQAALRPHPQDLLRAGQQPEPARHSRGECPSMYAALPLPPVSCDAKRGERNLLTLGKPCRTRSRCTWTACTCCCSASGATRTSRGRPLPALRHPPGDLLRCWGIPQPSCLSPSMHSMQTPPSHVADLTSLTKNTLWNCMVML